MTASALMCDRLLRIGQRVSLYLPSNKQDQIASGWIGWENGRAYVSNIQDLLPDSIVIAWPTDPEYYNGHVLVSVGQPATLVIKSCMGLLRLDSEFTALVFGDVPVLHVARRGDWSRSQLRNNVRLQITIFPTEVAIVWPNIDCTDVSAQDDPPTNDWLMENSPNGTPIEAIIRDISAGGVLLGLLTPIDVGYILKLRFRLNPGKHEISCYARVMWVGQDDCAERYVYKAGCQFLNLRLGEQDRIARFIFAKQVELRRRGLM